MLIGVLVNLILVAVILGLLYWALSLLPIAQPFLKVAQVAMLLILVLYLLSLLGGFVPPLYRYHP